MKIISLIYFLCIPFFLFSQESGKPKEQPIAAAAFAKIKLEGSPDFLAVDEEDAWILNTDKLQKLSVKSTAPVLQVNVPGACGGMVIAFHSVWVTSCTEKMIYRIDNQSGKLISKIPCGVADPNGEIMLAAGAGSVWALSDSAGVLTRIDAETNKVQAKIAVRPGSYCAVYGYNAVWVSNTDSNSVQRVDPETNQVVATIPVGKMPRFLAAGENGVWTLNQQEGSVTRIDPVFNKVVSIIEAHVPGTGGDIATGAGFVWVRAKARLLQTIDPLSNHIEITYTPVAGSGAVRATENIIWVTAHDIHTLWILKR